MHQNSMSESTIEAKGGPGIADFSLQELASLLRDGSSPVAILRLDVVGRVSSANALAKKMLGIQGGVIGRDFFSDVCPWAVSPLFMGRFVQAMQRTHFDETFPYVLRVGRQLLYVHARLAKEADGAGCLIAFQ